MVKACVSVDSGQYSTFRVKLWLTPTKENAVSNDMTREQAEDIATAMHADDTARRLVEAVYDLQDEPHHYPNLGLERARNADERMALVMQAINVLRDPAAYVDAGGRKSGLPVVEQLRLKAQVSLQSLTPAALDLAAEMLVGQPTRPSHETVLDATVGGLAVLAGKVEHGWRTMTDDDLRGVLNVILGVVTRVEAVLDDKAEQTS